MSFLLVTHGVVVVLLVVVPLSFLLVVAPLSFLRVGVPLSFLPVTIMLCCLGLCIIWHVFDDMFGAVLEGGERSRTLWYLVVERWQSD